jgi:hypothetical protein
MRRRSRRRIDDMKVSHILCAVLACAPLSFAARATAASEDGHSSAAVANAGGAAGRAAPTRDSSSKAGRTSDLESSQTGVRTRGSSTGRDAAAAVSPRHGSMPQRGIGRTLGGNADRLHSLLNAQGRGRLARQPGRRVGSTRAATGGPSVRAPNGVGAAGQPNLAASKRTASPAPKLAAISRDSTIGGPHAQGIGRLGGPVIGRTTHSATIDGTQLRRKF